MPFALPFFAFLSPLGLLAAATKLSALDGDLRLLLPGQSTSNQPRGWEIARNPPRLPYLPNDPVHAGSSFFLSLCFPFLFSSFSLRVPFLLPLFPLYIRRSPLVATNSSSRLNAFWTFSPRAPVISLSALSSAAMTERRGSSIKSRPRDINYVSQEIVPRQTTESVFLRKTGQGSKKESRRPRHNASPSLSLSLSLPRSPLSSL